LFAGKLFQGAGKLLASALEVGIDEGITQSSFNIQMSLNRKGERGIEKQKKLCGPVTTNGFANL